MGNSYGTHACVGEDVIAPLALRELGLSGEELEGLRRAGFVTAETRGRSTRVYVLRYRAGGKQKKVYVRTDASKAEEICTALAQWQEPRRAALRLKTMAKVTGQLLRATKQRLAAPLAARGFGFHGQEIRRRRQRIASGDDQKETREIQ